MTRRGARRPRGARSGIASSAAEHLAVALTHRSFGERRANNETLEFLGDAVLSLAMSDLLMARFPDAREGELSKMRASARERRACWRARRARSTSGRWLRLGKGEERSGGREKESILAAAYEALLGAVYLDAGYEAARARRRGALRGRRAREHVTRRASATTRRGSRS